MENSILNGKLFIKNKVSWSVDVHGDQTPTVEGRPLALSDVDSLREAYFVYSAS